LVKGDLEMNKKEKKAKKKFKMAVKKVFRKMTKMSNEEFEKKIFGVQKSRDKRKGIKK